MENKKTRLPVNDAVNFLADKLNSESYRKGNIELFRKLHGDQYADAVQRGLNIKLKVKDEPA